MVLKLLPHQIPEIWNAIKFAAAKSSVVNGDNLIMYLTNLLHSLLSSKSQCFIRFDNDRQLLALAITKLMIDEVTGEKTLHISHLYSFKSVENAQWKFDMEVIKRFAIAQKCKKITTNSSSTRVFEIVNEIGFEERFRNFCMEV